MLACQTSVFHYGDVASDYAAARAYTCNAKRNVGTRTERFQKRLKVNNDVRKDERTYDRHAVHELFSQVRFVIPFSIGRLISVLWIALKNIRIPNGGCSA